MNNTCLICESIPYERKQIYMQKGNCEGISKNKKTVTTIINKIKVLNYFNNKCPCCERPLKVYNRISLKYINPEKKQKKIWFYNSWQYIVTILQKCTFSCINCTIEKKYKTLVKKQADRKRKKKDKCIQYLGNRCILCGYNKNQNVLVFHHTKNKKYEICTNLHKPWDELKKELNKCILLCKSCHDEEHYIREHFFHEKL